MNKINGKTLKRKMAENKILKLSTISGLLLSACATSFATTNVATTEIKDVVNTNESGKKSVVYLNFNKEVKSAFSAFVVADKKQIIIDLNGVDRTFTVPPVVENDPLISKVATKIIDNKVRLLIETKEPVKFNIVKQGAKGVLLLESSSEFINQIGENKKVNLDGISDTWTEIKTTMKSEEKNSTLASDSVGVFSEISRINLKKSGSRDAKLTLSLSEKGNQPVMKKEGNKLIIDFKNVSIPNELQRRVNTENVGVITQSLDVSMQKGNARIILEQKDNWDYSFYQVEKQFVIEIKSSDKKEEEKKYIGKPLTISLQDMEVRSVLQVIADFTGLNIMSSDQVQGNMTLRLKDVPWDQALDLVLESRGLQKVKDGNVIWVATSDEVTKNNDNKLKLKTQSESLEALKLEFFQVNYYKAEELKKVLEGTASSEGATQSATSKPISVLSSRGSIGLDIRNNILFVQDTEEKLKEIRKLIRKLDISNKQVLVEAKIVIADSRFGKDIGSRFGIRYRNQSSSGNNSIGIGGNITEAGSQAVATSVVTPLTNLASAGLNSVSPGVIGLTLLSAATGNALGLELSALEQNQRGKVLSTPRLLTADNKKAFIEQGTEVPYVTPGTTGSPPTVSFKKAVLRLDVTPQIAPNGKVIMDLNIRKDTIGQLIPIQGGGQIPSIDTKNINTMVTVNNGQTVVLGGVYELTNENDISKIPFFGDIPFLGNLFKHTLSTENKGELMIFITPYVIEEQDLDNGEEVTTPEVNLEKK